MNNKCISIIFVFFFYFIASGYGQSKVIGYFDDALCKELQLSKEYVKTSDKERGYLIAMLQSEGKLQSEDLEFVEKIFYKEKGVDKERLNYILTVYKLNEMNEQYLFTLFDYLGKCRFVKSSAISPDDKMISEILFRKPTTIYIYDSNYIYALSASKVSLYPEVLKIGGKIIKDNKLQPLGHIYVKETGELDLPRLR